MEFFINEQSLHGQYKDVFHFIAALKQFMKIFYFLQEKDTLIYKNSEVFLSRKTVENEFFESSFAQIKDTSLRIAFKNVVYNKTNPKDWKDERVHLENDYYFCHTTKECVTDTTLAEVAERNLQNEGSRLLISFWDSCYKQREILISKENELLENAMELSNACSVEEVGNWVTVNTIVIKNNGEGTILLDTTRFVSTSNHYKGAKIFKETETGYLWYLDTLHETERHFEVFDSVGDFIGSANLVGEIDFEEGKNKPDRKLPKNCL